MGWGGVGMEGKNGHCYILEIRSAKLDKHTNKGQGVSF